MDEIDFGQMVSVNLRTIWPGEATHFTPWLAANLDLLSKRLDMDLQLESTEVAAGNFSADIVAMNLNTNRRVVIENQYDQTDHKHLGQLLTYASVLDASTVVWVAETIRLEHKSAIDFLNQNLKESLGIYALEVSAIRIDESRPAFMLKVVCSPLPSAAPSPSGGEGEIQKRYRAYFQELIDELRTEHRFTNARAGQPQNWYSFSTDMSKVYQWGTSFATNNRVRVEVYIDCGDKQRNECLFDHLLQNKVAIENCIHEPLSWERLENSRACRVAVYKEGSIDTDTQSLSEIRQWVIQRLLKFKNHFPSFIAKAVKACPQGALST